ncbi:MAG: restriction endonuclease subunit S [Pirellula sp.]|nr:restriction endonuclease subunit S [Pirellula sp.]
MSDKNILPTGWIDAKVGDVIKVRNGCAFKSNDYCEAGIPVVRQAELKGRTVDLSAAKYLPESFVDDFEAFIVKKGDLLIGMSGSLGKVARYESETIALQNQRTGLLVLTPAINERFAGMIMRRLETAIIQKGKGIAVQNVSSKEIENEGFSLPPLAEQIRIASRFDELESDLDAGVAALKRAKANLKRYRASVLKAAVEGKLTEEWRAKHPAKEPASALLARILKERRQKWEADQLVKFTAAKKEPPKNWREMYVEPIPTNTTGLPELPADWTWASVQQVGSVQLGRQRAPQHHSGDHMRPYLRVANVFEDRIDTSDVMEMNFTPNEFETYRLGSGDILLNEGQSMELVGRPAIYRDEVPGACFTNTLVRFRVYDNVDTDYALRVFLAYLKNGRFQKIATITVNIAHLGAGRFAEIEFPLPPIEEQAAIIEEVDRHFSLIDAAEKAISLSMARASRLRQSILKQAFEGRLVPQDPKDEPASVLLERLRASRSHDVANGTAATTSRSRKRSTKSKQRQGGPTNE